MKFLRIPVLALATLTVSLAVKAQTVDEIVNNHITAIGGKAKIDAMKSMYVESEMDIMGTVAPSVTTVLYWQGLPRVKSITMVRRSSTVLLPTKEAGPLTPARPGYSRSTARRSGQCRQSPVIGRWIFVQLLPQATRLSWPARKM